MASPDTTHETLTTPAPAKKGKLGLILAILLAAISGGSAFYLAYSGMITLNFSPSAHPAQSATPVDIGRLTFLPVPTIVISLGPVGGNRLLRLGAQLETGQKFEAELNHMMPRILDVMNSYLRAVEIRDLDDGSALVKIRSHLLYRVQLVTGEEKVRDLLITEFVLN